MAQERKEEGCERTEVEVEIGMDWVNICQTFGKIELFGSLNTKGYLTSGLRPNPLGSASPDPII